MAKFQQLIRKASSLLNLPNNNYNLTREFDDGEIIFSKNNICIHTVNNYTSEINHFPGYLTIKVQIRCDLTADTRPSHDKPHSNSTTPSHNKPHSNLTTPTHNKSHSNSNSYKTLILSWIPNETLWKNPKSILYGTLQDFSPSPDILCKYNKTNNNLDRKTLNEMESFNFTLFSDYYYEGKQNFGDKIVCDNNSSNNSDNNTKISQNNKNELNYNYNIKNLPFNQIDLVKGFSLNSKLPDDKDGTSLPDDKDTTLPDDKDTTLPDDKDTTLPDDKDDKGDEGDKKQSQYTSQIIDIFNIDLKQIKSLRLFFSNLDEDFFNDFNEQLVIVDFKKQYKIFHFHNGGLDKLASVLQEFDFIGKTKEPEETLNYSQFFISRPEIKAEECHPDENVYEPVNEISWESYKNELGQIENDLNLRKNVFFAGIDKKLRKDIWPFLVGRFDFNTTYQQREIDTRNKIIEYHLINEKRKIMNSVEKEIFWRTVQCTVEKDVVRTDRNNPFFAGDDNVNIDKMNRILLNYATYFPSVGYTQGMSDLLAPLLIEFDNEAEAFWSFVAMMQNTNFVCSPREFDIDRHLILLRELIRLMHTRFYEYLVQQENAIELLFVHRWILLCFKREFPEHEPLIIWESCWSNYQTKYFHLFLCLAVISLYGDDIIRFEMNSDDILFHFSTLSMHMNSRLALRKARGLLYQFLMLPKIPCTLKCLRNSNETNLQAWDSSQIQIIDCVRDLPNIGKLCQCTN